ncbi:DNA mismatch repair endonuclease MutL [Anaerolineae bacterium CFX9]|nr:DNA mismatch repair endonuclease MutL [Anaerolineae bacterium CFX9]
MPIHLLTQDVVAQIAAGEVVERPASVVKELLENAIDAQAHNIHIAISGDGRTRIQLSDDGAGIRSEEVELAFARHATSKLSDASDLYNIRTLGFRGEALASIASVSLIEMTTRHETDPAGTHIRLSAGEILRKRSVGAPRGTVIAVENLFFNTPARLKFLKSENTEKRQIASIVSRYAMAYPDIRFILEQDGREVFRSNGSGNLLDVLMGALGLEHARHMFEVDDTHGLIRVQGYTSAPDFSRSDRSRITLFVNGRWIQDSTLTYAVIQAYHTLLMTGRFPVAVLMIQLPPEDVDVNVHPTKAEVRFREADAVFSAVQRAVRRSVIDNAQVHQVRSDLGFHPDRGRAVWNPERHEQQLNLGIELNSPGQFASSLQGGQTDGHAIEKPSPDLPIKPRSLPMLRVIGQIAASYIVTEGPAGMYLIDQHAAHERVLFEKFMDEHERKDLVRQFTLSAQTIQTAPDEARLLEDNLERLSQLGFDIEPFGPNVFVIRAIPAMLSDQDPVEVIGSIVEDLQSGNIPGQAAVEARIVLRVCKQAAVKAGQILTMEQMQTLVRQLERCESPLTCPHGRPTLIHMSSAQLEREFGRIH